MVRPRKTLFRRVSALVGVAVFVSVLVPSVTTIRAHRGFLEQKLIEHGVAMTKTLSSSLLNPLARRDAATLREIVKRLVQDDPQVKRALVTDAHGEVIADSLHQFEGTLVSDLLLPPPSSRTQKVLDESRQPSIRVTSPIKSDAGALGSFRAELPLSVIDDEFHAAVRRVLVAALPLLGLGVLAAAWLARSISRPVSTLSQLASEVAIGNFQVPHLEYPPDEVGTLARAFEHMAANLSEAHGQLQAYSESLEARVAERTQQLEIKAVQLSVAKEEAEQANNAKSTFLASVSHELRTPLHVILNYADFGIKKMDRADKSKLLRYFDEIRKSASTLQALVNDLLDLSKLEAGKMELKPQRSDLHTVVLSVCSEFELVLKERGLSLDITPPGFETLASFDVFRVSQVLRNLISNAVKFTRSGGAITVSFAPGGIDSGGMLLPSIQVSVADQGIGIPEEELESIFDKFTQSSLTTPGTGGTGLGLTICREIIQRHGGWIRAQNRQGGGAVLTFCIPTGLAATAEKPTVEAVRA